MFVEEGVLPDDRTRPRTRVLGNGGPTVSVRTFWPFARLMSDYDAELELLQGAGVTPVHLVDPDVRISEDLAMLVLRTSIAKATDPTIGLRAAEQVEPGDFGPIDYASRNCATLREALECYRRFLPLLDEGTSATLTEEGTRAIWTLTPLGIQREAAANDFMIASSIVICRRLKADHTTPIEVHLTHSTPTDLREYRRVFGCPVRMNQPANAVIFCRESLDRPVPAANRHFRFAFEKQAAEMLRSLPNHDSVTLRVREIVLNHIGTPEIEMPRIAKRLHMSVATLRRRLESEGTSHRALVEAVRRDLALHYLRGREVPISDIAYLLGFSSVQTFGRAFRRWTGRSAMNYRASAR